MLMKVFSFLTLAGLSVGGALLAQAPVLPPLQGLTISLSSSHQTVALPPPERGSRIPNVVGVMATLRNRSARPIEVAFDDLESARGKFVFSLYREEDDTLLWSSVGQVPSRVAARVLEARQRLTRNAAWSASAKVPLQINGEWLAAGKYRIEAVLAGSPSVFAALGFTVTAATHTTGLRGLVLRPSGDRNTPPTPVAGAAIAITPAQEEVANWEQPVFQGVTAADGRFEAGLPAGEYWVQAQGTRPVLIKSRLSLPVFLDEVQVKASVRQGRMSEVTLSLPPPMVIDPPPLPEAVLVPAIDQASVERVVGANGEARIQVRVEGTVPHPGYGNARLELSPVVPAMASLEGGAPVVLNFLVDVPNPRFFYPMVITTVNATFEMPDQGQTLFWIQSRSGRTTLTLPAAGNQ